MNRTTYRPKPASAGPPFWLTLLPYLIFAFWRITSVATPLWGLVAFVVIPLIGGLIAKTPKTAWTGVGWSMAFFSAIGLIRAGSGVRSGEAGGHFFAALLTILVFSQLAGGVAALVAYLRKNRPLASKESPSK